jgi:hypothetical protein
MPTLAETRRDSPLTRERLFETGQHACTNLLGARGVDYRLEEHDELVTTEPGDRVARTQRLA